MDSRCQHFRELQMKAFKKVVNDFSEEIATHIVQLWLVIDDCADKAKPLGTGVLLEINGKLYLLTAAHVLDNIDIKNFAFWDEQDLVQVSGNAVYLSNRTEGNGTGDIAVWQLSDEVTDALKKHYKFLPFDRIKLNHQINTSERYFILGYPVSKTKIRYQTKTITIKSMKYFTCGEVSQRKIEHNQLDSKVNFLLKYHRRKAHTLGNIRSQKEHLPDPHGISGCGLWYLDDDKVARLVGIMIGYNHPDSIMIASRIDLATEIIRKSFDSSVPASTTINVKWI